MREMLFRGKRKDNGEWVYGYYYVSANIHYITISYSEMEYDLDNWEVDENSVGQFTGVYDKNGNKVFEGDIVKSKKGSIDEVSYDSITFNLLVAQASAPKGTCVNFFGKNNPLIEIEVIGNIHDNPELLK
jgi:hypothetical protein